ncbi:MAG: DUF192 domain-containing protein [Nanoarchaeota archaeon]|nr:DUF192 domain-containing protein [Nanoarchaeota archaeon]
MRKEYWVLLPVLVMFLVVIFLIGNHPQLGSMCIIGKTCFNVELVSTSEDRELGLGGRESLNSDEGMFFVFPLNDYYGFWMKDMLFPIDLIWINGEGKIVGIEKNMQPCGESCEVFYPDVEVKYVLEINSGMADIHGLVNGDIFQ